MIGLGKYTLRVERPRPPAARRDRRRAGARLAALGCVLLGAVALGSPAAVAAGNGGTNLTINAVPTTVSVTVSPASETFADCTGGAAPTASTSSELGFPNGECSVGSFAAESEGGSAPITITNTGIAAVIDINSASAGNEFGNWGLCQGAGSSVTCDGTSDTPGENQFELQNFVIGATGGGAEDSDGLTTTPACDTLFDFAATGCSATAGQSQNEGVVLTGPSSTPDATTTWSTSVTWTAIAS
jgi:hypothetical protein